MLNLTNEPAKKITVTIGGRTFEAGQRTVAHLLWTIEALARRFPKARLVVLQGPYNQGVSASAGTHDYDGVLDVAILGLDWWAGQRFLRQMGWADWFRHTGALASSSRWHHHMISLGCPGPVGKFIDGGLSLFGRVIASSQIEDYYHHAFGLEGQHTPGSDDSWFPPDIDSTIFNYPAYLRDQEDKVPYLDWPAQDRQALVEDLVDALAQSNKVAEKNAEVLLAQKVDNDPVTTVKAALRRGANT